MLTELSKSNPVFAPGVANYVAMGGVRSLWQGDLRACLAEALAVRGTADERAREGAERGGRHRAQAVIDMVLEA
jgi:malonate decarboxylase gamma subunit